MLVHLTEEEFAREQFAGYKLDDVSRIADPECELYTAFGLGKGGAAALFGPKVWLRGLQTCVISGHGMGKPRGDVRQMPGVFLVQDGQILKAFRAKNIGERVDLVDFATGAVAGS